jgi:hypothetical protein
VAFSLFGVSRGSSKPRTHASFRTTHGLLLSPCDCSDVCLVCLEGGGEMDGELFFSTTLRLASERNLQSHAILSWEKNWLI